MYRRSATAASLLIIFATGCDWGGDSSRDDVATSPAATGGDNAPSARAQRVDPLAATDTDLLQKAAGGNLAEVQLGMLAADRAQNEDVRIFALRMVEDHTQAGEDLRSIADDKGLTLPDRLDAQHLAVRERLARLRGESFDREYMSAMVNDHREAVSIHQRLSREARDPDLRAYAVQTLPILRMHLEEAEAVLERIGGQSSGRQLN